MMVEEREIPVPDDMLVEEKSTRQWIWLIQEFLKSFEWLANSFVLDFYQEDHWKRLPSSWQEFLPCVTPEDFASWLDLKRTGWGPVLQRGTSVPPLGLCAFKACVQVLSLKRSSSNLKDFNVTQNESRNAQEQFRSLFSRHVKAKKRHEIERFSKVVSSVCEETSVKHVFDVGSGLGHLARYLTYGCGLNLVCVDYIDKFGENATKFDEELKQFLSKKNYLDFPQPPSHLCLKLELNKHEKHLQADDDSEFGIVGLHSCGNLGPVIIHNYVNSPARFVVSVGCCYMKLDDKGFPLSQFAKALGIKLSYEALEVSCHALEQYCKRLEDGQVSKLLTHAYRGTLETILINSFGIRRAGLRGGRHTEKLSFEEYAFQAVRDLEGVQLTKKLLHTEQVEKMLKDWYKVVLFYSLRLLIANVVETAVILDRALFIQENVKNGSVKIVSLFDAMLSPRNFAVIGVKGKDNSNS